MLAKRIIPCLDIKEGRTVKGVNFVNLQDAGDAVELAKYYEQTLADELIFLDITASHEKRATLLDLVAKVALNIRIPFTVGGGIGSVEDAAKLLQVGADKISINSAAIKNPRLISDLAKRFGSQCVVLAIDAKWFDQQWKVYWNGGRVESKRELFEWAKEAEKLGAGEILFTSMNHDGTKKGFANDALCQLSEILSIPVIASGGAGCMDDFEEAFRKGKADAALAASVFHYKEIEIPKLKAFLEKRGIVVRT